MSLANGTKLGPYEILAPIGAGGMGEVYKARDTRLDRTVAVKILPGHMADQPEVRQRFEREAKAVSSLNHPHICTLFDVGRQDDIDFLVMEYLEGETLQARLLKGPLPMDQVLRYAVQIAEALAQAHRQGVSHRDLKPGNIILTKTGAKLLDFGLAKLREPRGANPAAGLSTLPTMATELTQKGTILGTFQYMAPEQLEGKEADARSDIFAFGAVLYEMATGRKAFSANSQASLITAIMSSEPPPLSAVQSMTPPALDRVVKKCLAKDPDDRWQSAQDLASELKWIAEGGGSATTVQTQVSQVSPSSQSPGLPLAQSPPRPVVWMAFAGIATLAAALLAIVAVTHLREAPPKAQAIRFTVAPPEKTILAGFDFSALSPDGERLAFTATTADGKTLLYVRPLDSLTAQLLAGTDGAFLPFWSPDSRYIAFFADGKLKKIDAQGGPPLTLCDAPIGRPGAWNRDGVILFRPTVGPLYRVSAAGGEAKPVTTLDASRQETFHAFAQFLPDGRHFIYTAVSSQAANSGLYAASLDSKETKRLVATTANGAYSGPPSGVAGAGYLFFTRADTLMAQPFDAEKLALSGEPFPVAEQVQAVSANSGALLASAFSVSERGTLAYRRGSGADMAELVWLDRNGKRLGTLGEPADYTNPALSPDEKKLAISRMDLQAKTRDIWLYDLVRGTSSRFTFDPADDLNPAWSPDGSRIAFTSTRKGSRDIFQKTASGTGQDELLLESTDAKGVEDWSPDGKTLLFNNSGAKHPSQNVWMFPLGGGGKPSPVVESSFATQQAQLSPNGRWMAYRSNESGKFEVYVQSFPPAGGKWQVSTSGGEEPRWRRDGKELFYLAGNSKLMAVDVKTEASAFEAGIPKPLFEVRHTPAVRRNHYVVTANGQKFLAILPLEQATSSPITVVVNWLAAVKK